MVNAEEGGVGHWRRNTPTRRGGGGGDDAGGCGCECGATSASHQKLAATALGRLLYGLPTRHQRATASRRQGDERPHLPQLPAADRPQR